jgi:hypothetical protein
VKVLPPADLLVLVVLPLVLQVQVKLHRQKTKVVTKSLPTASTKVAAR